ncbi:MAG: tetratricopeptide repeat protein [Gammaproteobacteria bacterium]|nr:tetratricopeptide repeat protein [Gammaproteobacteria bacterium]
MNGSEGTDRIRQIHRKSWRLIDSRRFAEALPLVRAGLKDSADDPVLLAMLGMCLWETGKVESAGKRLRRACRLATDDARLQSVIGIFFYRKRRFAAAARCFRRACELVPGNHEHWYRRGSALAFLGEWKASAQALQTALSLNPNHADAHFELGKCRLAADDLPGAIMLLDRAAGLEPGNLRVRITAAAVREELDARESGRPGGRRIVLHTNNDLHLSILGPVLAALAPRHYVRITGDPNLTAMFNPELVIVADAQAGRLRPLTPGARYIYVRHGLITKNHAFKAAGLCDYLAGVSSPAIRDLAIKHGGFSPERVWVTGHVQMDPLFRGIPLPRPVELPQGRRTVLFAPTYNPRLSAAPMLGKRAAELLRGGRRDLNIVIKPHPITWKVAPDWLRIWRRQARDSDDVYLVEDPSADAMSLLQAADVLVSDACSMAFAYLVMDRPIILLTNPDHREDPNYDPVGIEWLWRDLGEELFDAEELPAAVARALDHPERHADRRARYRELLYGDLTDGRAAERIAAHIDALSFDERRGT